MSPGSAALSPDTGVVHIAGIGGVGMSALAQGLLDRGLVVSGSDRLLDRGDLTSTLACLQLQGVRLYPQDGSGITPRTARLVVSTAIEQDNPEMERARAAGLPVLHRAAELAALIKGRRLVAVTGTCGKSTVTAMLGAILEGAGFDPLVVNGAAVPAWSQGGERIGAVRKVTRSTIGPDNTEWAVVEADESDRSLMVFHPDHAIVTNASADHFDMAETLELFAAFKARVRGVLIDGGAEAGGGPQGARPDGWGGCFTLEGREYRVPMPGMHNLHNAWHAVRMALALGATPARVASALAAFSGVERRLQRVGECAGAVVVDDYAHNPEKLAAAWETLATAFPQGVCAVWRPHGYAPLRKMLDGLVEAFARVCRAQDTLLLLPVYDVGGTADRSVGSDELVFALGRRNVNITSVATLAEAEAAMRSRARAGMVLATFGARDPGLARLARRLAGNKGG